MPMHHQPAYRLEWGIKLRTLADRESGYTHDLDVCATKGSEPHPNGPASSAVMQLSDTPLNQGYHLYFNTFYTSPQLMQDLSAQSTMACGTIRANQKGYPHLQNGITPRSKRGEIRWCRDQHGLSVAPPKEGMGCSPSTLTWTNFLWCGHWNALGPLMRLPFNPSPSLCSLIHVQIPPIDSRVVFFFTPPLLGDQPTFGWKACRPEVKFTQHMAPELNTYKHERKPWQQEHEICKCL